MHFRDGSMLRWRSRLRTMVIGFNPDGYPRRRCAGIGAVVIEKLGLRDSEGA